MRVKYACGGKKRKMSTGGSVDYSSMYAQAANLVGLAAEQPIGEKPNVGGKIAAGAVQGAAAGAALGPWGAVAGAAIGGIASGITASKEKKQYEKNERMQDNLRKLAGRTTLGNFPVQGNSSADYYAYGGRKKYATGGYMMPLNKKAKKAYGATHENGGIDLPGNIEVEDQEVQISMPGYDIWFSDRLGYKGKSFAKHAEKISAQVAAEEEKKAKGSVYSKGTATRNVEKLDMATEALATLQDFARGRVGSTRRMAEGGLVPYLDNVANMAVTTAAPLPPKPVAVTPFTLPTEYNSDAEIENIRSQIESGERALERTTSSSSGLRANIVGLRTQGMRAVNDVLQKDQNTELQLRTQDALNKQQVSALNTGQINQYNQQLFQRRVGQASAISANAANLVEDDRMARFENNQRARDVAEIELLKEYYKTYGVYDRTVDQDLEELMTGTITIDEFKKRMQKKNVPPPPQLPTQSQQQQTTTGNTNMNDVNKWNMMFYRPY